MPEPSYLLISLVFSSIGMGYFIYGSKQKHKVAFYTGICLMVDPYVITSTLPMVAVGVGLLFAPKFIRL